MKKSIFFLTLVSLLVSNTSLFAQDHVVDLNQLTNETQFMSDSPDLMRMVWYIPIDYWEAVFDQDPTVSDSEAKEVIDALKDYELFAIVDGDIGSFGNVKYRSRSDIRRGLTLTGVNKNVSYSLDEDETDSDARGMLNILGPVIANMMGDLGKNMHFFVFKAEKNGKRVATPKSEGLISISVGDENFDFEFPLGSLLPLKLCPIDQKEWSGAWNYCPIHGAELKQKN